MTASVVVPRRPPAGQRVRGGAAGAAVAVRRGRGVPAAAGQGVVRAPVAADRPHRGWPATRTAGTEPGAGVVRERHLDGSAARRDDRGQPAPDRGRATATGRRWSTAAPAAGSPTRSCYDAVEALAAGLVDAGVSKGDRVGIWAPNRWEWVVLQYATADIGAILVNINPAYRTHELEYVLNQAGISLLVSAPAFKTSDYRGDGRRGARPRARRCGRWSSSATRSGRRCRRGDRSGAAGDPGRAELRRPDQHPVHVRDHRVPEGRDALAPQHPQQRLLRRRAVLVHARRTGSASRCPSTTASAW